MASLPYEACGHAPVLCSLQALLLTLCSCLILFTLPPTLIILACRYLVTLRLLTAIPTPRSLASLAVATCMPFLPRAAWMVEPVHLLLVTTTDFSLMTQPWPTNWLANWSSKWLAHWLFQASILAILADFGVDLGPGSILLGWGRLWPGPGAATWAPGLWSEAIHACWRP